MSFIKIKDPRKREELIKDLIETRKRIKDNFMARKVGEAEYQTGLTKLFKPVTETQKATAKEITEAQKATAKEITEAQKATAEKFTSELLPIKEGIEELPTKLFRKIFPSIEFKASDIINFGPLAVEALLQAFTKKNIDLTYGIYAENGKFKIGDKSITIVDNDIEVKDKDENILKTFEGTPGFWELVTSRDIKDLENYKEDDLTKYRQLVTLTNTAYRKNNSKQNHPKASRSNKWKNIISYIWEAIKQQKKDEEDEEDEEDDNGFSLFDDSKPGTSGTSPNGSGLFLPSDPNALIDRFDLLFSSKKAGHTGVKNEIVAILDELKRQKVINVNEYKKLNSLIKK